MSSIAIFPVIPLLGTMVASFFSFETTDYQRLREDHVKYHSELFDHVKFDLGQTETLAALPTDERLSNGMNPAHLGLVYLFIQLGRYLLINSSRGGAHPENL